MNRLVATLSGLVLVVAPAPAVPAPPQAQAPTTGETLPGLLCARSADGRHEVRWLAEQGLVLLGPHGSRRALGPVGLPRFAADGRLVVATGRDDGDRLLEHGLAVLDPPLDDPRGRWRRPRHAEPLPPWAPPLDPAGADPGGPVRVCVDAGHGGSDPGAQGHGLDEKDVTLDVALALADRLTADTADTTGGGQWDVLLTRQSDVFVSLLERVTVANAFGADSFVSIHANAFGDPAANGTETYAFAEGTTAADLRDAIHARMLAAWGLTDRGTKTAGFYVLVNTAMPASLSEMGFVTNPGDALLLGDPAARDEMALAHLFALQEHHGFGVYEPGGGGGDGTLQGILYDASQGSGSPLIGATVALADGRATTTNGAGFWAFDLAAGPYQLVASAPDHAPATAGETVTSGVVWESFGLQPAAGPTLAGQQLGSALTLTVHGDPFASVWLVANLWPQLPLTAVGSKGVLWPAAAGLLVLPVGPTSSQGLGVVPAVLPDAPGAWLHVQALVGWGGQPRLTNGVAFAFP